MADPLTLTAVTTVALAEGIKFLYNQAGEVLKRWRERKDEAAKRSSAQAEPMHITLPSAFEGQLVAPQIHFEVLERFVTPLRELRQDLSEYAAEIEPIEETNAHLLQQIDALRQSLEAVYQQRLTFKGEHRPPSGPLVRGRIEVDDVLGYAAGVRARTIRSGQISGQVQAGQVGSDGTIIGVDVDTIGG